VATLALGIGANTAIFSLIDAVMLRLLPVRHPEELVLVQLQRPGDAPRSGFTNALWEAVRDQQDVFSDVFASSAPQPFDLRQHGSARYIQGIMISGGYFDTLGIAPAAGRLVGEADDRRGCPGVAVLSYGFWQSQFGGSDAALGSTITLNRQSFQVIGVSARRFFGIEVGKAFDVAVPVCAAALFDRRNTDSRSRWWLEIVGRVKPGVSSAQLASRLEMLSPSVMAAALPDWQPAERQQFRQRRLCAVSVASGLSRLRTRFGEPLVILMGAVALVLLIACANITSLMLAKATTRGKEMAIRTAIGASRARLVRQLLTEAVFLSSIGAAIGLLFAKWSTALLVRGLATGRSPVFVDL
jgi:predicted permease